MDLSESPAPHLQPWSGSFSLCLRLSPWKVGLTSPGQPPGYAGDGGGLVCHAAKCLVLDAPRSQGVWRRPSSYIGKVKRLGPPGPFPPLQPTGYFRNSRWSSLVPWEEGAQRHRAHSGFDKRYSGPRVWSVPRYRVTGRVPFIYLKFFGGVRKATFPRRLILFLIWTPPLTQSRLGGSWTCSTRKVPPAGCTQGPREGCVRRGKSHTVSRVMGSKRASLL